MHRPRLGRGRRLNGGVAMAWLLWVLLLHQAQHAGVGAVVPRNRVVPALLRQQGNRAPAELAMGW